MSVTTIAIQLDACRFDYINQKNTPFLFSLSQEGLSGRLVPTFGFEPDAAYLAGLYPDEADGGMHFWYAPETSIFRFARFLPPGLNSLPVTVQRIVRRLLAEIVRRTTISSRIKYVPHSARIPFRLMRFFDIAEKYLFIEDEFLQGRGIFSILRSQNKSFLFLGSPTHSALAGAIFKGVRAAEHPYDFIFLHIGDLDTVGHRHGPRSKEVADTLKRIDEVLSSIWTYLESIYGTVHFVLIGDHGMVEVKELFDIEGRLNKLNLKLGTDYLYFLDSTFARFYFFNDKAKQMVSGLLQGFGQGHVLTQEEKDRYHLNYPHNRFGDLIFLADPGVLIFPNFWNNTIPEKGMHGYAPEYPGQQSAMVIYLPHEDERKSFEEPFDMRRIFPTLLKLAGLYNENHSGLESIV